MQHPSPFRRIFAFIYDSFIAFAILMMGTYAVLPITHGQAITPGNHWYQAYLVSLLFLYWGGLWFWRGQTIGMVAWHIKLAAADDQKLKFSQVLIRFFTGFCLSILGLLFCFANQRKQAIYDIFAKTKIIRV